MNKSCISPRYTSHTNRCQSLKEDSLSTPEQNKLSNFVLYHNIRPFLTLQEVLSGISNINQSHAKLFSKKPQMAEFERQINIAFVSPTILDLCKQVYDRILSENTSATPSFPFFKKMAFKKMYSAIINHPQAHSLSEEVRHTVLRAKINEYQRVFEQNLANQITFSFSRDLIKTKCAETYPEITSYIADTEYNKHLIDSIYNKLWPLITIPPSLSETHIQAGLRMVIWECHTELAYTELTKLTNFFFQKNNIQDMYEGLLGDLRNKPLSDREKNNSISTLQNELYKAIQPEAKFLSQRDLRATLDKIIVERLEALDLGTVAQRP